MTGIGLPVSQGLSAFSCQRADGVTMKDYPKRVQSHILFLAGIQGQMTDRNMSLPGTPFCISQSSPIVAVCNVRLCALTTMCSTLFPISLPFRLSCSSKHCCLPSSVNGASQMDQSLVTLCSAWAWRMRTSVGGIVGFEKRSWGRENTSESYFKYA